MSISRRRSLIACLATAAVLAPLVWLWSASLLPDEYSVMDMGYADYGGGPGGLTGVAQAGHGGLHAEGLSIAELVADKNRPADVKVHLVARKERFQLDSGREVDGYT
ncbi:MAG: multicopper oxidase family protein, partial [Actinomycetes bacterium]